MKKLELKEDVCCPTCEHKMGDLIHPEPQAGVNGQKTVCFSCGEFLTFYDYVEGVSVKIRALTPEEIIGLSDSERIDMNRMRKVANRMPEEALESMRTVVDRRKTLDPQIITLLAEASNRLGPNYNIGIIVVEKQKYGTQSSFYTTTDSKEITAILMRELALRDADFARSIMEKIFNG